MFSFGCNNYLNAYSTNTEKSRINDNDNHFFKSYNHLFEFTDVNKKNLISSNIEHFITGFNNDPSNCAATNLTTADGIGKCKQDLSNNYQALINFSTIYRSSNDAINKYYYDISSMTYDVSLQNSIINGKSSDNTSDIVSMYNYIDYSGNIINDFKKKNTTKNQFLDDIKEKSNYNENLYMVSFIGVITFIIFIFILKQTMKK